MLRAADAGFWFHAPPSIVAQHADLPACDDYPEFLELITAALAE